VCVCVCVCVCAYMCAHAGRITQSCVSALWSLYPEQVCVCMRVCWHACSSAVCLLLYLCSSDCNWVSLSAYMPACLPVYLRACMSVHISVHMPGYMSAYIFGHAEQRWSLHLAVINSHLFQVRGSVSRVHCLVSDSGTFRSVCLICWPCMCVLSMRLVCSSCMFAVNVCLTSVPDMRGTWLPGAGIGRRGALCAA
jgi:hypothetical protein